MKIQKNKNEYGIALVPLIVIIVLVVAVASTLLVIAWKAYSRK